MKEQNDYYHTGGTEAVLYFVFVKIAFIMSKYRRFETLDQMHFPVSCIDEAVNS